MNSGTPGAGSPAPSSALPSPPRFTCPAYGAPGAPPASAMGFVAGLLHAIVLWAWHAPALFQSTLHSEWAHAAQHVSFLTSALLFWWSLLHARSGATAYGVAVLYLFTTAVHSGLLGALLTFAR